MKINIFNAILTVFMVLTVFHTDSIAQPKGRLNGRVTDKATGEPMPGVNVIVPGTYHGAATDLDGRFAIRGITAGEYTVRFQFIGYTTVVVTGVKITVGLSAELDAALDQTVWQPDRRLWSLARNLSLTLKKRLADGLYLRMK